MVNGYVISGTGNHDDYELTFNTTTIFIDQEQIAISPIDRTIEYGTDYEYHHIDGDTSKALMDDNDTWVVVNDEEIPNNIVIHVNVRYIKDNSIVVPKHVSTYVIEIESIDIYVDGILTLEEDLNDYHFDYESYTSTLTITKRRVLIALDEMPNEEYDGLEHKYSEDNYSNYRWADRMLPYGDELLVHVTYENEVDNQTINAGDYYCSISSFDVKNEITYDGRENDYELFLVDFATKELIEYEIFTIDPTPITVEFKDKSNYPDYQYNGKETKYDDSYENFTLISGTIANGDSVELVPCYKMFNANTSEFEEIEGYPINVGRYKICYKEILIDLHHQRLIMK